MLFSNRGAYVLFLLRQEKDIRFPFFYKTVICYGMTEGSPLPDGGWVFRLIPGAGVFIM